MWKYAAPGFYLSDFYWASATTDWYHAVKECTNAPVHAHYTGRGTPDEPKSGGAKDYNDCPWECDAGYGRSGDECISLCTSGISHLRTGDLSFNIYPTPRSTPSLHVLYNGQVCYVSLSPGSATDAINVKYNGQIFHTVN